MNEASALPLAGFQIVEVNDAKVPLCLRLATSLAGKIAADLGADVLKIEPAGGDPVRCAPPLLPQGESALFQFLNTSKRSVMLDLASESGRAALADLAGKADVVLFEEAASVAAMLRTGKATPVEIAAFPLEMDAAQRPVSELAIQALGVGLTIVWIGVVSVVGFLVARLVFGLRVDEESERIGLDISSHGESAYES